jgi:hypothetical protein
MGVAFAASILWVDSAGVGYGILALEEANMKRIITGIQYGVAMTAMALVCLYFFWGWLAALLGLDIDPIHIVGWLFGNR